MNPTTLWLRAAVASGGLVAALAIVLTFFYPVAQDGLPGGFNTPILALEFATSMADARAVFGDDRALMQQMQTGHRLDILFALFYGSFLTLANFAVWRGYRHWTSLVGMAAAVVAAIADATENGQLLKMGAALLEQGPEPDFTLLRRCVETKFLAIGIAMLLLGRGAFSTGVTGKLFAVISLALLPVTFLGLGGNPTMIEAMTAMTGLGWMVLLAWLLVRRKGLPAASRGDAVTPGPLAAP